MAATKKEDGIRNTYKINPDALEFIEDFSRQTTLTKHKIVSDAILYAKKDKQAFLNFVHRATLTEKEA